ncbi:MAG TPA: hypothetical protein VGS19_32830 [Streptosporangiaceae bacterium]|nr:hypothetical protein [Streptosporangiaceae bacterium]
MASRTRNLRNFDQAGVSDELAGNVAAKLAYLQRLSPHAEATLARPLLSRAVVPARVADSSGEPG